MTRNNNWLILNIVGIFSVLLNDVESQNHRARNVVMILWMNERGFSQARIRLLTCVGVSERALWLVSCSSRGSGAIRRDYRTCCHAVTLLEFVDACCETVYERFLTENSWSLTRIPPDNASAACCVDRSFQWVIYCFWKVCDIARQVMLTCRSDLKTGPAREEILSVADLALFMPHLRKSYCSWKIHWQRLSGLFSVNQSLEVLATLVCGSLAVVNEGMNKAKSAVD